MRSFLCIDSATARDVPLAAVADAACQKEVLLVGEYHDDPVAHAVEAKLLALVLQRNGYNVGQPGTLCTSRGEPEASRPNKTTSPAWRADPRLGLTGAPNFWTALHEDPHAFSNVSSKNPSPDATRSNSVARDSKASSPDVLKTPERPASAPPSSPTAQSRHDPDCFQSLSSVEPGMYSACASSGMVAPGASPSLSSAAANAAAADSLRPYLRGGYNYMSKSVSNLYGMLTRRPSHSTDTPLTSPPSIASDLDSLADEPNSHQDALPALAPLSPESSSASHPPSPRGLSPTRQGAPPPALPAPAPDPSCYRTAPLPAASPSCATGTPSSATWPRAQPHALPYSTWIWGTPATPPEAVGVASAAGTGCGTASKAQPPTHADHWLDANMDTITRAATPNAEALSAAASRHGLSMPRRYYQVSGLHAAHRKQTYQRSPLATAHTPSQLPDSSAAEPAALGVHAGGTWQLPQLPSAADMLPAAEAHSSGAGVRSDTTMHATHSGRGLEKGLGLSFTAEVMRRQLYGGAMSWRDLLHLRCALPLAPHTGHCDGAPATSCASAAEEAAMSDSPHRKQLAHGTQLVWPLAVACEASCSRGAGVTAGLHRRVVLSMEMFERDVQHVVDEYTAGLISLRDLIFDGRAWPNFEGDYLPLINTAACCGVRVLAANAPRRYASFVARNGLPAAAPHTELAEPGINSADVPGGGIREAVGLPVHPEALAAPSDELKSKITREMALAAQVRHAEDGMCEGPADRSPCGHGAEQQTASGVSDSPSHRCTSAQPSHPHQAAEVGAAAGNVECPYSGLRLSDNFFAAQALWDATMADSILCALHSDCDSSPLVMHVCGKFHMEEGLGICEHLRRRRPQITTCTVVCLPVDLPVVQKALEEQGGATKALAAGGHRMGLPCSVEEMRKLGDFVVLTDANLSRTF